MENHVKFSGSLRERVSGGTKSQPKELWREVKTLKISYSCNFFVILHTNIRIFSVKKVKNIALVTVLALVGGFGLRAQEVLTPYNVVRQAGLYEDGVEDEDGTMMYFDYLKPAKVVSKLPKQKGRDWKKYYRLVYNFSQMWPYAKAAERIVATTDSTIVADGLKGVKREQYVGKVQDELFELFEDKVRKMTVSQGVLLMKLIDRQVGKTSYLIIKDYKSGMAAGFWQMIAKMFDSDLKKPYDPKGDDALTEELIKLYESGEFDYLYYHLFWEYPKPVEIPEKYRK